MSEAVFLASIEGVKLLIKMIMTLAEQQGMSKEELDAAFNKARAELDENDPSNLPDV